jgi:hypothetical protein
LAVPAPTLAELQGLFWRSLASEPGGDALEPALVALTEPSPALAPPERLRIYADMYFWRLLGVLRDDFPRVAELLGSERFAALAGAYLQAHPSENGSVRHVGRHLARFMTERGDVPAYLPDLARLEWARVEVFDAPDVEPLGTEALRRVPPEDWPALRFTTVPAFTRVASAWPVHAIWREGAQEPFEPAPTAVRVWRTAEGNVVHAALDRRADAALDHVRRGATFAELCGAFGDLAAEEAAREATALLARWVEDGILRLAA